MAIRTEPLREDLPFGARIAGVTEAALDDPGVRQEILQTFDRRGMIVFEGMEPSNRLQVKLSKVFGPLKEHPVEAVDLIDPETMAGAIRISSNPETSDLVEIDGRPYSSWLPWHFDHCYNNELNRAGVLRAVEITSNGGETGFIDGIWLYDLLSPELRRRIEGQSIIYTMAMELSLLRFGRPEGYRVIQIDPTQFEIIEQAKRSPRALHPAVWTRPTGEKVLHVSPWMSQGINGHEDAAGDELLTEVCEEISRLGDAHGYFHRWKLSDMLIWDNWRMLHRVTGCTPPEPRSIQRTTIKGDYGLGRFENDDQGHYQELERTV